MNQLESIRNRKSSRTYLPLNIELPQRSDLLEFIKQTKIGLFGESIHFQLIEHESSDLRKMKNDYGLIINHRNYILAKVTDSAESRMNYGYLLEKIVLHATAIGLDTCWMGMFDPAFFPEVKLASTEFIPAVVIVGYAAERRTLKERAIRFAVGASKRKPWDSLFFMDDFNTVLNTYQNGKYAEVLQMTRLSPSAGNTQPWRIIKEKNADIYHFYKKIVNVNYNQRGLHDVDMGICLSHFELSATCLGLEGSWMKLDMDLKPALPDIEYKISWLSK